MRILLNGTERDIDPGTFRAAVEEKGVVLVPAGGRLSLTGPESSVKAARAILDANEELEKAIAEEMYAEKVRWYEAQVKRIESRTLAEGERLFRGAVSDVSGEGLLSRGRLS